jgi:hypothetical protein
MEAVYQDRIKTCSYCIEPLAKVALNGAKYTVIEGGDDIIGSKICFHLFHAECIRAWVEAGRDCPDCRDPGFSRNVVRFTGFTAAYETYLNAEEETDLRPSEEAAPVRFACVTATQLCVMLDLAVQGAPEGRVPSESKRATARTTHEKINDQIRKVATEPFTENEQRILRDTVDRNKSFLQGRKGNSRLMAILRGLKNIQLGH